MQTATNESAEPWLDEGLTEYTSTRYLAEATHGWGNDRALAWEQSLYASRAGVPATLPSWEYANGAYVVVYSKTALGLWTLESVAGTDRFRQAMAGYLAQYRFKHPNGAEFRAALEQKLGDLGWLFDDYLSGSSVIDYAAGSITNTAAGSMVQIVRKGGVRVPTDILITFRSGAQYQQTWDGQAPSLELTFPSSNPVVLVQVDPFGKLKAELNRLDNQVGMWQTRLPIAQR
jgi:hypothetical protein